MLLETRRQRVYASQGQISRHVVMPTSAERATPVKASSPPRPLMGWIGLELLKPHSRIFRGRPPIHNRDVISSLPSIVAEAASKGILARLSPKMRSLLLTSGNLKHVPPGTLLYAAEDQLQFVGLILDGFLRVFVAAVSGRESTIRYVRPGDLLGVVAALSGPSSTWVQTLSDSRIWMLDPIAFRRAAQTELEIAWVIAEECARRVADLVNEISGSAFATVRQRIAHHLLSMARSQPDPPFLAAHITQMDLANAAGSVREVTVRELRTLRDEGLVRLGRGGIAIVDPDRLEKIAAEAFRPRSGT